MNVNGIVGTIALGVIGTIFIPSVASAEPRDALAALYGEFDSLKREYEDLNSKVDGFLAGSRKLREMDKDEITKLIIQVCNLDIERDGDEESRIANSLIEKVQSNVKSEYSNLESSGKDWQYKVSQFQDKLKTHARNTEPFTKVDEVKSDASKLYDQNKYYAELTGKLWDKIDADYKSLTNIKNGVMLGSNNPRLRAAMDWGKAKHEYNQRICDEKEVSLSSGRPDCVSFRKDACAVWEFKPSTVGESAAKSQAERYLSDVRRYFKDDSRAKQNCKYENDLPVFEAKGLTYEACTPNSVPGS
jgi:hypothetical protein